MGNERKKKANKPSDKEMAAKKYENLQTQIFDYFNKHDLHVVTSDMLNKAFLSASENPTMFMAEYLLNLNNTNAAEKARVEIGNLKAELKAYKEEYKEASTKLEDLQRRYDALMRQNLRTIQTNQQQGVAQQQAVNAMSPQMIAHQQQIYMRQQQQQLYLQQMYMQQQMQAGILMTPMPAPHSPSPMVSLPFPSHQFSPYANLKVKDSPDSRQAVMMAGKSAGKTPIPQENAASEVPLSKKDTIEGFTESTSLDLSEESSSSEEEEEVPETPAPEISVAENPVIEEASSTVIATETSSPEDETENQQEISDARSEVEATSMEISQESTAPSEPEEVVTPEEPKKPVPVPPTFNINELAATMTSNVVKKDILGEVMDKTFNDNHSDTNSDDFTLMIDEQKDDVTPAEVAPSVSLEIDAAIEGLKTIDNGNGNSDFDFIEQQLAAMETDNHEGLVTQNTLRPQEVEPAVESDKDEKKINEDEPTVSGVSSEMLELNVGSDLTTESSTPADLTENEKQNDDQVKIIEAPSSSEKEIEKAKEVSSKSSAIDLWNDNDIELDYEVD